MEAEWLAKRATLRWLLQRFPHWTNQEYADYLGTSVGWVKTWKKRLKAADPDDLEVLHARSTARKTPAPPLHALIVERIVQIRLSPPQGMPRVPGARTICTFLQADPELQAAGITPPRSSRTVNKVLHREGLILPKSVRHHQPLEPREPLEEVQADFKTITTIPAEPGGKQVNGVECCNFVDAGTSILLSAQVRDDFRAETAFDAVITVMQQYGRPGSFRLDRDPRWIGGQMMRDFPSALLRTLLCLGVEPVICPPKRPDKNPFVERYNRSYTYECILVHRPETLQEAQEVTRAYQQHYNWQRPHQGRSCQDQPPRVAFPIRPCLPLLPQEVDPDAWLAHLHGRAYLRHIDTVGNVKVDEQSYYVGRERRGHSVARLFDAPAPQFQVWEGHTLLKLLPIKGIVGSPMKLGEFLAMMREQARALEHKAHRHPKVTSRPIQQHSLWGKEGA